MMNASFGTALPFGWGYDAPDPSVGLFGEQFTHDRCKVDFEQGVEWDSQVLTPLGEDVNGYVAVKITMTCLDCGISKEFRHLEYTGKDPD